MASFSVIRFVEFLHPGGLIQRVAEPRPEEETDPSPEPVVSFISSLSIDEKSEHSLWTCDVVPGSMW